MVSGLEGKIVKEIRPMTDAELSKEGWDGQQTVVVIVFTDGTLVYPSQDPEGNGGGALFGIMDNRSVGWS